MSIVLRDYQNEIISEARSLMSQGVRSILICSPTGSGKTALTAHMLKAAASKGLDSWFLCHRKELIYQSAKAFNTIGVDHGIVCAGVTEDLRPHIQVCSVPSMANRISRLRKPRLIIYDESHHIGAASWERIYKSNPQAYHLGLTASPIRMDGRGLGDFFERMITGPSVSSLISNGYLSKYRAYAPPSPDLNNVHTKMGDFVRSEITSIMDRPMITGDAISEYAKHARGKRNVVFCTSIVHSKNVAAQFNSVGITAAHVDGETPHYEREQALRDFQSGKIKVLTNVDLFGEGLDVPSIECVTLLRPTQSVGLHIQQIGRALRPSPGKDYAIILDQCGNIERHGLPDEDREWSLTGAPLVIKSKSDEVSVRVCSVCFAAQPSGKGFCIYCQSAFKAKPRTLKEIKGELEEINAEELRRKREARKVQGQTQSMQDLINLGRQRGYKRPEFWAKHVFNSRQRRKVT